MPSIEKLVYFLPLQCLFSPKKINLVFYILLIYLFVLHICYYFTQNKHLYSFAPWTPQNEDLYLPTSKQSVLSLNVIKVIITCFNPYLFTSSFSSFVFPIFLNVMYGRVGKHCFFCMKRETKLLKAN